MSQPESRATSGERCILCYAPAPDPGDRCDAFGCPYRQLEPSTASEKPAISYQQRVEDFMLACFGEEIANDQVERNHRFLEEALELVQATGCPVEDARMLVEYVYGRPKGEAHQETGGVMVTLAALCSAANESMDKCGEDELRRVWGKIEVIREKQKKKPKGSPLPQSTPSSAEIEPTPTLADYRNESGVGSVIECPKCRCSISVEQQSARSAIEEKK